MPSLWKGWPRQPYHKPGTGHGPLLHCPPLELTRHCDDCLADGVAQVGLGSLLHLGQRVGANLTRGVPLTASLTQGKCGGEEVWESR